MICKLKVGTIQAWPFLGQIVHLADKISHHIVCSPVSLIFANVGFKKKVRIWLCSGLQGKGNVKFLSQLVTQASPTSDQKLLSRYDHMTAKLQLWSFGYNGSCDYIMWPISFRSKMKRQRKGHVAAWSDWESVMWAWYGVYGMVIS